MIGTRHHEDELHYERRASLAPVLLSRCRRVLLVLVVLAVALLALGFALPLVAAALFWPPAWPLVVLAVAHSGARRKTGATPSEYVGALGTTARGHRRTVLIGSGVGVGVSLTVAVVQLIGGGGGGAAIGAFAGISLAITIAVVAYLEAAARKGAL